MSANDVDPYEVLHHITARPSLAHTRMRLGDITRQFWIPPSPLVPAALRLAQSTARVVPWTPCAPPPRDETRASTAEDFIVTEWQFGPIHYKARSEMGELVQVQK